MVNESQGSDNVVRPKGDSTPDTAAATLSQNTWDQMDTAASRGPADSTLTPTSSLTFDNSIYNSGQPTLADRLTNGPVPRSSEAPDAPPAPSSGAIETKDLQRLSQEGIEATKDIAVDSTTSDRDRYRSIDMLVKNKVTSFENDGTQYEILTNPTSDSHEMTLMRETSPTTTEKLWSGDNSLLQPANNEITPKSPTRSIIRPGDENTVVPSSDNRTLPGEKRTEPVDPVTPQDRLTPGDPNVPQDRTTPGERENLRPQENQTEKTKEQKLFDPSVSPEDKIKIAKELSQEGKNKVTGPDGKTYDINVKQVGNRTLVAIMGDNGKPLMRGIVEKDGSVSKQRNGKGQFVDIQSDYAKKNSPDNPLIKYEPKQPDRPIPARPERPPESDPQPERPPVNPVLPEQPITPPDNQPEKPPVKPDQPVNPPDNPVKPENSPDQPVKPEKPPVNPEQPPEKPPANPDQPPNKPPSDQPSDKPPTDKPPETLERPERAPEVEQSRNRLRESAERSITDPQARQKFLSDMDTFERRAREQGLSPQEVSRTMDQTRRLLDAPQGATSAENRILAARGLAHHLANPSDTNQGSHNTCGPTSLGERTLTRNPSRAAEMVASTAIDGKWTSPDGKVITIPPGNLTPGAEERTFPPTGDHRTFATQLMNAALINDMSQRRMPPEFYEQGRPTGDGDTGERLYYAGQKPEEGRKYNGHTGPELAEEARRLNGDRNSVLQDPATDSGKDVIPIKSEADLRTALDEAKKNGNLPLIVFLDAADPSIDGNGSGPRRFHFVSVTGYDAKTGQVTVSNQWGPQHDKQIPVSDLYRAIRRRNV